MRSALCLATVKIYLFILMVACPSSVDTPPTSFRCVYFTIAHLIAFHKGIRSVYIFSFLTLSRSPSFCLLFYFFNTYIYIDCARSFSLLRCIFFIPHGGPTINCLSLFIYVYIYPLINNSTRNAGVYDLSRAEIRFDDKTDPCAFAFGASYIYTILKETRRKKKKGEITIGILAGLTW